MKKIIRSAALTCLAALAAGGVQAEKFMVSAVAPWSAEGSAYQIAGDQILFQGEFHGIMYFSGRDGALDASPFVCPARQLVETETGKSGATGHCTFEGRDGATVFADFECTGIVGACEGKMMVRGGTGHLAGIKGTGKMLIRTALSFTDVDFEAGSVEKAAEGIAIWPALEIDMPAQTQTEQ